MRISTRRTTLGLLFLSVAVLLSGCLTGKYSALIRYDAAKDEYTILNVYQRIGASMPADQDYLYAVWRNRDHIIRVPNIDIFTMPAFLRMSPNKFVSVNLGDASKELAPIETHMALDKIRVLPGTFFMRGPDALCYYDQVVLPGSVIDQALPEILTAGTSDLADGIDKELKRRADGGKRFPWADARKVTLKQIHDDLYPQPPATAPAAQEAKPPEPQSQWELYDETTLALLRKGVADGTFKVTRDKEVFSVVVPFSKDDAKEIQGMTDEIIEAITSDAKTHKGELSPFAKMAPKLLPAFKVTTLASNAVELKVDLAVILEQLPQLYGMTDALEPAAATDVKITQDTVAALKAHNVPIDEKLTVEQLAKDFYTGSIKSYPSDTPVTPGDGMVQKETTPQPKQAAGL